MQRYDDSLDSPVLFDGQASFAGGQNSRALPSNIEDTEAALLQDYQRDLAGRLSSRFGTNGPYATISNRLPLAMFYYQPVDSSQQNLYAISPLNANNPTMFILYKVDNSSWTLGQTGWDAKGDYGWQFVMLQARVKELSDTQGLQQLGKPPEDEHHNKWREDEQVKDDHFDYFFSSVFTLDSFQGFTKQFAPVIHSFSACRQFTP